MKKYLQFFSMLLITGLALSHCLAQGPGGKQALTLSGRIEDGVRVIEVSASRYKYEPDPIVVKLGEKIRIIARSLDVTHGFAVSEFKINAVVSPAQPKTIEFTATKAGEFNVFCTVFCGSGHAGMRGKLIVVKESP